jgi:hypothetical protein
MQDLLFNQKRFLGLALFRSHSALVAGETPVGPSEEVVENSKDMAPKTGVAGTVLARRANIPALEKFFPRVMWNRQTLHHRPLDSRCNLFAD